MKSYADEAFPDVERTIEVWSPKVAPAMQGKVEAALTDDDDVVLVFNAEYARRVRLLADVARTTSAYSDSPSFRLLQILTGLRLIQPGTGP